VTRGLSKKACSRRLIGGLESSPGRTDGAVVIRPERPSWEISVQKAGHVLLAVLFAVPAALIVWKLSFWRLIGPAFGVAFFLVSFIVLAVVFYSFLEWFRKRPDEIANRVPTPSKELRRKRKAFYDWLASQERR
jgi:hypothetical protein